MSRKFPVAIFILSPSMLKTKLTPGAKNHSVLWVDFPMNLGVHSWWKEALKLKQFQMRLAVQNTQSLCLKMEQYFHAGQVNLDNFV